MLSSENDGGKHAHGQGMETFLAGGVPDLITEYAVFEAAFLCEECSADCRLFVGLEFVVDLSGLVDGKERSVV
jgi:hypothetical protein